MSRPAVAKSSLPRRTRLIAALLATIAVAGASLHAGLGYILSEAARWLV